VVLRSCTPALDCTPSNFDRPKDVQGCPAASEEFSPTASLVLSLLFSWLPACVCVCVCVRVHQHTAGAAWGPGGGATPLQDTRQPCTSRHLHLVGPGRVLAQIARTFGQKGPVQKQDECHRAPAHCRTTACSHTSSLCTDCNCGGSAGLPQTTKPLRHLFGRSPLWALHRCSGDLGASSQIPQWHVPKKANRPAPVRHAKRLSRILVYD